MLIGLCQCLTGIQFLLLIFIYQACILWRGWRLNKTSFSSMAK